MNCCVTHVLKIRVLDKLFLKILFTRTVIPHTQIAFCLLTLIFVSPLTPTFSNKIKLNLFLKNLDIFCLKKIKVFRFYTICMRNKFIIKLVKISLKTKMTKMGFVFIYFFLFLFFFFSQKNLNLKFSHELLQERS